MNTRGQTGFEALLMTAFVILLIVIISSQAFKEQDVTTAILIAKSNSPLLFTDQNKVYIIKTIEWKNYGILTNTAYGNTLGLNIVTLQQDIFRDGATQPFTMSSHPRMQEWLDDTEAKIVNSTQFDKVIINFNRPLAVTPQ